MRDLLSQIDVRAELQTAFRGFVEAALSSTPRFIGALVVFALFVLVAWTGRRAVRLALNRMRVPARIRMLITRFVLIGGITLGGVLALAVATGSGLGQVLAGFGLLSVGLAFALKNILENMISGILTIFTAPFHVGDEIEIDGYIGRVEAINIQETILRTFDGKRVAVPNRDVYINTIINQTSYPERRYDVVVGIHYDDNVEKARAIAADILDSAPGVRDDPAPLVLVTDLGESSVNLTLRFWGDPRQRDETQAISTITAWVKEAFDEAGITIPFPIRTLHVPDGALPQGPR